MTTGVGHRFALVWHGKQACYPLVRDRGEARHNRVVRGLNDGRSRGDAAGANPDCCVVAMVFSVPYKNVAQC